MYKSMLGQMTLLTVIFIGGMVYYLGVRPILESTPATDGDPLLLTGSEVVRALSRFIQDSRSGADVAPLEASPLLRQVRERNPRFRYYLRIDDREFGSGADSYYRKMQLDEITRLRRRSAYPDLCTQVGNALDGDDGQGSVSYIDCNGQLNYYEYSGLQHPLDLDASLARYYPQWVWSGSRGLVLAGAGMFLIFTLIVMINVVMIRRITAVTKSFDPKNLERKLPEKGLPSEVVPLVKAVNEMISKVDEAQKRRDFFLSTAAHEMRTPLTVLRTRLEMLGDGPVKDKLVGDVGRLTSLANQLLKLMSINSDRRLDTLVDLVAACRKVIAERELLAEARGIALQLESAVPTQRIVGDAGLIEVAIANLVDNAISFSPDGGRVVLALDGEGRLSVRDFGPGIPEENLSTLFEPFAKFPPNRNGHGLGLAIVKAVAVLHGAGIRADNAAGGGAVFTLHFEHVD